MEEKYFKINNIVGWLIWAIATAVYLVTIEPTASFWDCGEFISAAYKLQIGHPPGAPFWMIVARVFGLFATDVEGVAAMVNAFSGLCSSFSILFLFWSITAIAKKMAMKSGEMTMSKTIAIMGSGVVGGLAYTFSDSFWFSAVEAEVYAASSFFTAAVFWLILKWEANADKPFADRYLIFLAYLMGLSIGVHILNLLAIPAIVYVYYFKRFKVTPKGFVYAGILSVALLGIIQQGVISYSVKLATKFELFFVNSMGMPFNSGMWIYFVLLLAGLSYGIWWSAKAKKPNIQNALMGVLVILIGYSSFALIVVRSAANPPMDENNPENILSLLPYLNREQYGDRPLLQGQSFTSTLDAEKPYVDGSPVYYKPENSDKDEYKVADDRKNSTPNYDEKTTMYFPRMYSSQGHHARAYRTWSNFEGRKVRVKKIEGGRVVRDIVRVPTFGENWRFFVDYQIMFSYWRYFMWNFAGRQNDIQGHGKAGGSDQLLHGNWISGLDFIDSPRLGDQNTLPDSLKDNPARNTFFMLPLLLGLIGMIYSFARSPKDAFVVFLMFFMTGIAVIIYLNPTPFQPRERDYAYAGSFYAFAVWIGLGVYAIYHYLTNTSMEKEVSGEDTKKASFSILPQALEDKLMAIGRYEIGVFGALLIVAGILNNFTGNEGIDMAFLYAGGVISGTLVVTYFLGKVVTNNNVKAFLALLICLPVPLIMGAEGWDDHSRADKYTARDFARNYLDSCEPNAIIFTNGDNDTFPLWFVQEVEGYRTDVRVVNLSLLNTDWYIDQMKRAAYESDALPITFTQDQYRQGTRDYVYVQDKFDSPQPVGEMIDFVKSDNINTKLRMSNKQYLDYLPSDEMSLKIDLDHVLENGTVLPELKNQIDSVMTWSVGNGAVLKAKLMILDMLAHNNWKRPIYFAITVGDDHYMNLEEYFQLEGLAYRVTPVKHEQGGRGETGWVHVDKMYDNLMNNFQWGNMNVEGVYLEEQTQRMCMNFRNNFSRLAKELIRQKGDKERAEKLIDKCLEVMPPNKVPLNIFGAYLADAYYLAGAEEKGDTLLKEVVNKYYEELKWYLTQENDKRELLSQEISRANQVIMTAGYFAAQYGRKEMEAFVNGIQEDLTQNYGNVRPRR